MVSRCIYIPELSPFYFRFIFVFLCLVLSIFATLPLFEVYTGKALFYMVCLIAKNVKLCPYKLFYFLGMQSLYNFVFALSCIPMDCTAPANHVSANLFTVCFAAILVNDVTSVLLLVDF